MFFFVLIIPRPPRSTPTDTLLPYTTLVPSTARYNPLGYIDRTDPDQVVIELQKIATMLFVPPERGEPFWTDSARTASWRSEEHTSELQSLMRISYAVFCLKKKKTRIQK